MSSAQPVRVAVDVETTGLQAETESIIEIGAIKFRGDETLETFQTFIAPRRPLPYRIQRLTNITPAMLKDAPQFGDIAPTLRTFLGDLPLVGHSVGFDANFLRKMHIGERNALIDTFELASLLLPSLSSYSLESVASFLQLPPSIHHRAMADAVLARDVLLALEARIAALPDPALNALCDIASPQVIPMMSLLRRERQARGGTARSSEGFAGGTTLGAALNAKMRLDPAVLGTRVASLDVAAPRHLAADPLPDAALPSTLDETITTAFAQGTVSMVELSPEMEGVMAALTPAVRWALGQQKRLVIATASIAGARGLMRMTLARAIGAMGGDATAEAALLAESQDYLCTHRWYGPTREAARLSPDGLRGLAKLTLWMHETEDGLRDEVTLGPTEQIAWETVRAGTQFTDLPGCAYREKGWCFARRAREAALKAQIIVTTHAALLAGQQGEAPYVPHADAYLILDAHQFEDRTIAQATFTIDEEALRSGLSLLWNRDGRGTSQGLLLRASQAIPGGGGDGWGNQVTRAHDASLAFFAALSALVTESHEKGQTTPESAQSAVRLDGVTREMPEWSALADAWHALEKRLNAVAETATQAAGGLAKQRGQESLALELSARTQWLRQVVRWGREAISQPRDGMVYWVRPPQVNVRPGGKIGAPHSTDQPTLHGAPAHATEIITGALQRMATGTVLAGTALTVDGSFDYMLDRLGLSPSTPTAVVPIDRQQQTLVLIPTDVPEPNMPSYQRSLTEALIQTATALEGRTVAIFASHTALRTSYAAVKAALERQGILVLGQGVDGSLRQLWNNYRSQEKVVLLGAGGIWDGWESEGARPTCLFIARLPLAALSDPLLAARAESHADAMRQFIVPHAALRMRQAFNRLAWEHTDRNVVVIFDTRVLSKDYGATILHTLPSVSLREESVTMLGTHARDWVEGM